MTLFEEIKVAGIKYNHWYSDLYIPNTPQVREILSRHRQHLRLTSAFIDQIDGENWLDIPFAYEPFWGKVAS